MNQQSPPPPPKSAKHSTWLQRNSDTVNDCMSQWCTQSIRSCALAGNVPCLRGEFLNRPGRVSWGIRENFLGRSTYFRSPRQEGLGVQKKLFLGERASQTGERLAHSPDRPRKVPPGPQPPPAWAIGYAPNVCASPKRVPPEPPTHTAWVSQKLPS